MGIDNIRQPKIINIDEKLRLKQVNIDNIDCALPWYKDKEVLYYSEGVVDKTYDIEVIERMYKYLSNIGELYFIEVLENNNWISIGDVTLAENTMPIAIGNSKYRGKGISKKVINQLIERAKDIGLKSIKLKGIYKYNERSKNLFKSVGFTKISENDKEEFYEIKI